MFDVCNTYLQLCLARACRLLQDLPSTVVALRIGLHTTSTRARLSKDPFSSSVDTEEAAHCVRWTHLTTDEVIDLLIAEHVAGGVEGKRRSRLQLVLDLHGEHSEAASLPGIAVAGSVAKRIGANRSFDDVSKPYQVQLDVRADLVRSALSSSEHVDALMQNSSSNSKPQIRGGNVMFILRRTFHKPQKAADWRDGITFALYGMCATASSCGT